MIQKSAGGCKPPRKILFERLSLNRVSKNIGTPSTMLIYTVISSTLTTITIIGNVVVISVVLLKRNLRRMRSNLFVISLGELLAKNRHSGTFKTSLPFAAFTDLLIGTIVMPLTIEKMHVNGWDEHGKWLHGKEVCNLWTLADIVACTASIWNLAAIALDRLLVL